MHLAFLQVLAISVDPARYILKGGASLRFFYGSPRRSQDIDLDAVDPDRWPVEDRIDKVLSGSVFRDYLRAAGISISEPTKPKQTSTTRRWKFTVDAPAGHLPTKIEFSGRDHPDPERALETLRPPVGQEFGLRAIRVQRYLPSATIRQKVAALAGRRQTEPRDVFDLDVLLARYPEAVGPGDIDAATLDMAIEAALAVDYAAFDELVVRFLEESYIPIYRRPEAWDEIRLNVAEALARLR